MIYTPEHVLEIWLKNNTLLCSKTKIKKNRERQTILLILTVWFIYKLGISKTDTAEQKTKQKQKILITVSIYNETVNCVWKLI